MLDQRSNDQCPVQDLDRMDERGLEPDMVDDTLTEHLSDLVLEHNVMELDQDDVDADMPDWVEESIEK